MNRLFLLIFATCMIFRNEVSAICPDKLPNLVKLSGLSRPSQNLVISENSHLLTGSLDVSTIEIRNRGKLVIEDGATKYIRSQSIYIHSGGELHIGNEKCPYQGKLFITLVGNSTDTYELPGYGKKVIGVGPGGILEIHGQPKTSWTQLTSHLTGVSQYSNKINCQRGFNIGVINPKTGELEQTGHFDTHGSLQASDNMVKFLQGISKGKILAITLADEGFTKLNLKAKQEMQKLGSTEILNVKYRDLLVLTAINGDPAQTKEKRLQYTGAGKGPSESITVDFPLRSNNDIAIRIYLFVSWAVKGWNFAEMKLSGVQVPTEMSLPRYSNKITCKRGFNIGVISPKTGELEKTGHFDTHGSIQASDNMITFLQSVSNGKILAITVADEGFVKLNLNAKQEIQKLGSTEILNLKGRDLLVLTAIKGDPTETKESRLQYTGVGKGTNTTITVDFPLKNDNDVTIRIYLFVTWPVKGWSFAEMKLSGFQKAIGRIINLNDDVTSWEVGDRLVIASTDYDMTQAEEFDIMSCQECSKNQVKIKGVVTYDHFGAISDGVDMRAEVGLLTRNIVIRGEMQPTCYGNNQCQFFKYDTFGGHIKIMKNFKSVHLSGIELTNMGQQIIGSYPIHFHMCGDLDNTKIYAKPTYVKELSIHHCFSRCVTIHGTNALLVQDTVGYDTLGHCYFLEDGAEQRNTFKHNLGLVTRPGTLLPTDRDVNMCLKILDNVYPGYKPKPHSECMGQATFWITHPNNNLIDNAAAGSVNMGIWYIFHPPTGLSAGSLPYKHGAYSPMGIFKNNRAHSGLSGLFVDDGIKTTQASANNKAQYLSKTGARYKPHQDSDITKPRVPAIIDGLVSFKNHNQGSWIRGGDIFFKNSKFADNGIGLTMASEGSMPNDIGSHQEIRNSIFVGESENRGNKIKTWIWRKGSDGKERSMPQPINFPFTGVVIYDGPVVVDDCKFLKYKKTSDRSCSAIGFKKSNNWQSSSRSSVSRLRFDSESTRIFIGAAPNPYYGSKDKDGDLTNIVHDIDGSLTGRQNTYVMRRDNDITRNDDCVERQEWNASICTGNYANLYVLLPKSDKTKMTIVQHDKPRKQLTMQGISWNKKSGHSNQYQPVIQTKESYSIHWNKAAPKSVKLWPANMEPSEWINVALCYPPDTKFKVWYIVSSRARYLMRDRDYTIFTGAKTPQEMKSDWKKYYFDTNTGLLHFKIQPRYPTEGYTYCSKYGCEHYVIDATVTNSKIADCRKEAYPTL